MYGGSGNSSGNSDDDVSSYKNKQSSLSELMTSYWLEEWNNIIPKKGISKLNRPLRGYCCSPAQTDYNEPVVQSW